MFYPTTSIVYVSVLIKYTKANTCVVNYTRTTVEARWLNTMC